MNGIRIDDIDMRVIELLTFGFNNKQISVKLKIPLAPLKEGQGSYLKRD